MRLLSIVFVLILTGCVSNVIHKDYRDSERVSIWNTSCVKPYKLVRGCNAQETAREKRSLAVANIPVSINGHKVSIATTEDGKAIFLSLDVAEDLARSTLKGFTFGAVDTKRVKLEGALDGIVKVLNEKKASTIKVMPVTNLAEIAAYYIVSDLDIYSLIKNS